MALLSPDDYAKIEVLIAFSNPQLGQFVRSYFTSMGAKSFQIVADLEVASEILKVGNFNHLIVDYALPFEKDSGPSQSEGTPGGIKLVRTLRLYEGLRSEMPVLMVMGQPDRESVCQARNAGVNEILGLPLTAALIAQRLAYIHQYPKPFIRVPTYVGPCRRRDRPTVFSSDERRGDDGNWELQHTTY